MYARIPKKTIYIYYTCISQMYVLQRHFRKVVNKIRLVIPFMYLFRVTLHENRH